MEEYLIETPSIGYMDSHIHENVRQLMNQSDDTLDYIKRCYMFVRDEIPHSWDIKTDVVSRTASDVLKNKTGICWTKACLLSVLLRQIRFHQAFLISCLQEQMMQVKVI